MTYDPETDTVFIGTGNGSPWNRRIRSADQGDNLFLCSIVALDAKTGKYKWHYQVNPGESWDFNASMDMQLADLVIDGKLRKVVMQAPKNGFFYVIDRITGQLISADAIARVTWARGVDPKTGRADRGAEARYPNGTAFEMWPSPHGAHTWLPSAFSPKSGLMYLPLLEIGFKYDDVGINPKTWRRLAANAVEPGANVAPAGQENGRLLAWDPIRRQARWRVIGKGVWMGGVLATGGNLVFQGEADGIFTAYDAGTGTALWRFDAQSPVLAPPITYSAAGKQYVTVMSGMGTSPGTNGAQLNAPVNYRTQARRILTFVLDGKAQLARTDSVTMPYAEDPDYKPDPATAARGGALFRSCFTCHGGVGYAGGTAPELAMSAVPSSAAAFELIVRRGALVKNGMPRFEEFTDAELDDLRQYVRAETRRIRDERRGATAAK
jgi:quinohemoprotein ethanol dehydrogenase